MSLTDEENKNMINDENQKPANKKIILTNANQISDDDIADVLRGKKKITEVHFSEAVPEPVQEMTEEPKPRRRRKIADDVAEIDALATEEPKPRRRRKIADDVAEIDALAMEEPKPKRRRSTAVTMDEISLEPSEEPKPRKRRAKLTEVEEIDVLATEEPKPKRRTRKIIPDAIGMEGEAPKGDRISLSPEADNKDVNISISGTDYTETTVAASIEETEALLRNRIFNDTPSGSDDSITVDVSNVHEHIQADQLMVSDVPLNYDEASVHGRTESFRKIEPEIVNRADEVTTRYNSEMIIEELNRPTPAGENYVYGDDGNYIEHFGTGTIPTNVVLREDENRMAAEDRQSNGHRRNPSHMGGYRPISTSPRVFPFGLDEIPDAVSQLTRRAKLNETIKVTRRAKKLEKAGVNGRNETDCEEVLTFEFEGMSNAHVPLDNDSVFQIEGVEGYPGQMRHGRPPVTRGKDRNRKKRKKVRKPHGPVFRIISALLLVLIIFACVFGYDFAKKVCDDRPMDSKDLSKINYTVDANTTDDEVAAFLVANNLVDSKLYYKLRAILFDADYKPGTYEISPSYSTEKIINILSGYDYSAGKNN